MYYENNTWKNNLCFNIAKDNYQMMKSKAVVNKYYRNNTYIIEEEWLNKFNVDEKARIVNLEQQTSFSDNIVVDNNYIDVYYLIFHSSHPNITNYLFTNNKIKCKKSSNNIFMLGHSNEKISSSNYIVRNNFFDIGEKDKNTAIFQTYNDNPLNSIYKNIIFENNTFNLFIKTYDEVGKCYLFSSGLFGDNIVIRNNTINLEKDSNTEICLFNYTKMNYSNKFVFDNTFYSTNKVKNEYNWLAPDIIPRKKTNSNIKLETTTNGNVGFFLKGTFKERVDLVNIPKIDYKVKFILKKDSDFDIVRYLFFSLEKQNNEEKLTFYNSLGNQETVTVDPSSTSGIWNNFYFLDEDKKITTDYVSSTISNLDITIIVRTQLLYDTLDSEISIIGG